MGLPFGGFAPLDAQLVQVCGLLGDDSLAIAQPSFEQGDHRLQCRNFRSGGGARGRECDTVAVQLTAPRGKDFALAFNAAIDLDPRSA